jgi:hypothetical protein
MRLPLVDTVDGQEGMNETKRSFHVYVVNRFTKPNQADPAG